MARNMDFGEALFAMKAGRRVRRASWSPLWRHMHINEKKRQFIIETGDGIDCVMPINDSMVFGTDWQEVE